MGPSGKEMALFISNNFPQERQRQIQTIPLAYDRDSRIVSFQDPQDEALFTKDKSVLVIDGSVHSGHSLLTVVKKIKSFNVKSVISYSLIIKRGSTFVPNFFGIIIPDHDRVLFLLDSFPNNRIMAHGLVRKLSEEDVNNPIQSLNTGVPSIDNTTWINLWYETVAKGNHVYVNEGDHGIDAFISFLIKENGWMFIDAVARDISVKGKKIGSHLLRWAENWARSKACKGVELWALNEKINYYRGFDFVISSNETLNLGKEKYTRMYRSLLYHLEDCSGCRTD